VIKECDFSVLGASSCSLVFEDINPLQDVSMKAKLNLRLVQTSYQVLL